MKKIGIVTFHSAHNYGAMLQALALQQTLCEYDTKIINYRNKNIDNEYKAFILKKYNNPFKLAKYLFGQIYYFNKSKKRFNIFSEFMNKQLKLTRPYFTEEELINNYPDMDIYITGSDQVWNVDITKGLSDIYTLNFGDDKIKRIAYAASIGNSSINDNRDEYINKISKIDYISVRENDAKKQLDGYINKPISVMLDPTLLVSKEQWENKISDKIKKREPYILCYAPKVDPEYLKIVNYLSKNTNFKIIHFERRNNNYKSVLENAYISDPLDFVELIKNAEYVVTTSFHAVVFSIIFNKNFFAIPHRKTGARVTNLLEKLEITDRVYYNFEEFKNIDYNFNTDWDKVNKKLKEEREKSINWLKNAIEG